LSVRKLPRIALALAVAALAADVCLSLFFIRDGLFFGRPLPPFGALTHPRQLQTLERMQGEPVGPWTFDAELGWTWRPSSASEAGEQTINALGARGPREYEPEPAPGTTRVLTYGDSFTYCDEVGDWATFQRQLEQLDPAFEVLKFGVSAYGTDQALLRFRRSGLLGAEVACIGILLENVGRYVNGYRPLWATFTGVCMTKPRFVLGAGGELELLPQPFATRTALAAAVVDGSVLAATREHEYWVGRPDIPTGGLSALARIAGGFFAYRERTPAHLWQDPEGEPFRTTVALLEQFRREALAAGAKRTLVLVFPAKEDLREYALAGRPYWTALLAELDRRGIPSLDLVALLAERARELDEDPPGASLYKGGHLSPTGNALVARALRAWVRDGAR
jgi:hypothetical protein